MSKVYLILVGIGTVILTVTKALWIILKVLFKLLALPFSLIRKAFKKDDNF